MYLLPRSCLDTIRQSDNGPDDVLDPWCAHVARLLQRIAVSRKKTRSEAGIACPGKSEMMASMAADICSRAIAGGGFPHKAGGPYRPDATAWAILALTGPAGCAGTLERACERLAAAQGSDGRVPLSESVPAAYWPTPLAALAWKKAGCCRAGIEKALAFILGSSGRHSPKERDAPYGHDPTIKGWSWTEAAHSWIEPTALSILALRGNGYSKHARTFEGVAMIMDRQLPTGGWNYGNTTVFNQELLPMPEHTGQALCAVSGYAARREVEKSIEYLEKQRPQLKTPLSLCWCLFGLRAWKVDLPGMQDQIRHCLSLQDRYGIYDTTSLAQLGIALASEADLSTYLGMES